MTSLATQIIEREKIERTGYLDLGRCGLTEMPDLSDLDWLHTLIFSNRWWDWEQKKWVDSRNAGAANNLSAAPENVFPKRIQKLILGGDPWNGSWGISDWRFLEKLTGLTSLYLSSNQISDGRFLEKLTGLTSLDLSDNKISDGRFLEKLTGLTSLNLSSNQISDGRFLEKLTGLTSLDLRNNKISDGRFLEKLTGLTSLDLSFNQISDGRFLGKLTGLTSLDLSFNQISDGRFLGKLTNLTSLYLWNNQISDGRFLEKLTGLTSLNLSSNKISDWRFLEKLTGLTSLYLSDNQISDGRFLEKLTGLTSLNLSRNQISDGRFLEKLTGLTSLYLHNNKISDGRFLEKLTGLTSLDLSFNKISDGRFLEKLTNLNKIDLTENQLADLTPLRYFYEEKGMQVVWKEWYKTTNGEINVKDNPLTNPPVEVVQRGTSAILRYFEDLETQGTDQIYEAKLLLIGEGGAGKTTLCKKLFDPNAPLPEEKDRTKGIDIHPLYFDIPGKTDKQFRLNIWDFAGQGKYQSAHSFFYTHRSLYVLVDDTRTLNENDAYRTLYNNWLQTAELFGGQSPVLVLHNEKEGCARTGFSLGGFQERFGFVHGELFRINLGGGEVSKIEDLRRQIERQALVLPHIGDTVPKTWVKVRESIETERQQHPYISIERYRTLCAEGGIEDPDRQSDLSHYFHDLGVFLHFQDNPLLKRDVFLQNQWVTDAVYKILDDAQIAGEQRGRFGKSDLARLWHESTYRDRRDELLALMLQFELCYQVQDTETYVCPQLLPGDPVSDAGISDTETPPLQLKYEYVFMPKGLLYRLIVRLHRHIAQGQSAVWNAGAVLERAGAKAEVTESLDRRTISVRATGLRAKELVTIVHDALEGLHEPFGERLKVTVRIPCNCRVCGASNRPHFYDKTSLHNRLSKGKMTVECDVSFEDVPVLDLLEGVFAKHGHSTPAEIRTLFADGKTEQALEALCALDYPDAHALKGRFSTAKRDHLGGIIDFKSYEQVLNQVTTAGLGLLP